MRKFFILVIFLSLAVLTKADPVERKHKGPNVIIIFMDDLGYGDLESYGGLLYQTPNTTRMAAEGMRFTQFYSAHGACSPSRAALLTGCYPTRVGINKVLSPASPIALSHEEKTLPEILKEIGYATGMVGKWHLGHQKPFLPLQHGFDEYLGLPYSNDMWPVDYDGQPVGKKHRKSKYPQLPLIEGNEKVRAIKTLSDQAQLTTLYTERAIDFIRRHKKEPFFLYMAHSMPHVPLAVSDKFRGKSKAGLFGDVMMELDWSVGEVLKTLDRLKLSENTLVILTSDNGPWRNYGNHAGSTGGLREGKGTTWEGGQRVPCLMRWPGTIPAGTVNNKLSSAIDLLPTITRLCGGKLPEKKIDGVDITSLLMNEAEASPRDHFVYYYTYNKLEAIRNGTWKLVFPHKHRTYNLHPPGKDGWPGPSSKIMTEKALFNLRTDPGETIDLKEEYPEVVKQLEILAQRYREALGDELTNHEGDERRAPASTISAETSK